MQLIRCRLTNPLSLNGSNSEVYRPKLTVSLIGDIPAFRHYNGVQLGPKWAMGVSVMKDFCL